jgi:hypothetical protein
MNKTLHRFSSDLESGSSKQQNSNDESDIYAAGGL